MNDTQGFALGIQWGENMVGLTKMNQHRIVINADQIEIIETTPDTVITMTNGHKYIVMENAEEVVELIVKYKQRIFNMISDK